MGELRARSIAKGLTWRTIATLTTASLVYFFTESFVLAANVGALDIGIKLLFYYLHERAWLSTSWGTTRAKAKPLSVSIFGLFKK